MKFGVREICNVVLKAKAAQKVGKKIFYKNEPVMYFDTLKTSSMEGQSSTVYAQGGRGNPRLVAWEGERQVTFTMEDALISAEGLSILTGAGLIDAKDKTVYQHITEIIDKKDLDISAMESGMIRIPLSNEPYLPLDEGENFAYVMFRKDGDIVTEPYIPVHGDVAEATVTVSVNIGLLSKIIVIMLFLILMLIFLLKNIIMSQVITFLLTKVDLMAISMKLMTFVSSHLLKLDRVMASRESICLIVFLLITMSHVLVAQLRLKSLLINLAVTIISKLRLSSVMNRVRICLLSS